MKKHEKTHVKPRQPKSSYSFGQEWDKDKDGRLDYREFAAIFQLLGFDNGLWPGRMTAADDTVEDLP